MHLRPTSWCIWSCIVLTWGASPFKSTQIWYPCCNTDFLLFSLRYWSTKTLDSWRIFNRGMSLCWSQVHWPSHQHFRTLICISIGHYIISPSWTDKLIPTLHTELSGNRVSAEVTLLSIDTQGDHYSVYPRAGTLAGLHLQGPADILAFVFHQVRPMTTVSPQMGKFSPLVKGAPCISGYKSQDG